MGLDDYIKAGKIAVLSKSGTLLYEISDALTNAGFGQSITIGIGGDPVNGTRLIDAFEMVRLKKDHTISCRLVS